MEALPGGAGLVLREAVEVRADARPEALRATAFLALVFLALVFLTLVFLALAFRAPVFRALALRPAAFLRAPAPALALDRAAGRRAERFAAFRPRAGEDLRLAMVYLLVQP